MTATPQLPPSAGAHLPPVLGTQVEAPEARTGGAPAPSFLVLPRSADVAVLARAWFPEAAWVREPEQVSSRPAAVGARFRGVAHTQRSVPGALRLTWSAHLEGPIDAAELATFGAASPLGPEATVFRLSVAPGAPDDPRLPAWLGAAARRAGGAVLNAPPGGGPGEHTGVAQTGSGRSDGARLGTVVRADPHSSVTLTVFSAVPVPPEAARGLVRAVAPAVRVTSAPEPDEGIAPYAFEVPSQFDGTVTLRFSRAAELPVSLLQLDWRDYGPFAYAVGWTPSAELGAVPDEALLRVARARVRPVIARLTFAVQTAAGGAVVDEDGFVVDREELVARTVAM